MVRLDYLLPLMCGEITEAYKFVLNLFGADLREDSTRVKVRCDDLRTILEGVAFEDVAVRINSAVEELYDGGRFSYELMGNAVVRSVFSVGDTALGGRAFEVLDSGLSEGVFSGIVGSIGANIARLSVSYLKLDGLPSVGCVSKLYLDTKDFKRGEMDNKPLLLLDVDIEKLRERLMECLGVDGLHIVFRSTAAVTLYSRTGCAPSEDAGYSFVCPRFSVEGYAAADTVDFIKGADQNLFLPTNVIVSVRKACAEIANVGWDRRKCVYSTSVDSVGGKFAGVCVGNRDEVTEENGRGHEYWKLMPVEGMRVAEVSTLNVRVRELFGRQRLFAADVFGMWGLKLDDGSWFFPGLGVYTVVPGDGELGYFVVESDFASAMCSKKMRFYGDCDNGYNRLSGFMSDFGVSFRLNVEGDHNRHSFVKITHELLVEVLG